HRRALRERAAEMPQDEDQIRKIAHKIWEEVGQPIDQAKLHWEMAEKELEEAEAAKKPADPAKEPDTLPVLKSPPLV
ncbi:MAG TPA: DUF2934 domain-containing protein, partial [Roseiarcus sp.]|nr:DUF2934 domain-containing protein [Roseiarcus sp.]